MVHIQCAIRQYGTWTSESAQVTGATPGVSFTQSVSINIGVSFISHRGRVLRHAPPADTVRRTAGHRQCDETPRDCHSSLSEQSPRLQAPSSAAAPDPRGTFDRTSQQEARYRNPRT